MAAMGSVGSTVIFRVIWGYLADVMGARKSMALLLLLTTPAILAMMFVTDATGFIVCRMGIGIGLASFVSCQAWVSVMFSKPIVGLANATAGGWGNLGGGFTNLLMPFIFLFVLGVVQAMQGTRAGTDPTAADEADTAAAQVAPPRLPTMLSPPRLPTLLSPPRGCCDPRRHGAVPRLHGHLRPRPSLSPIRPCPYAGPLMAAVLPLPRRLASDPGPRHLQRARPARRQL